MKRILKNIILVALITAIAACPSTKKPPPPTDTFPQKVLLRYKFPPERESRYRIQEESVGRFSITMMPVFQQVKARNVMLVREKVVQRPIGGFTMVARKIESLRVQIWKSDRLFFDSARLSEFPDLPETKHFSRMKNKVVKFEINELGRIRSIDGMGFISMGKESVQPLQTLETGNPILPENKVGSGASWKDRREMSFEIGQGYRGVINITEEVTLVDIKKTKGRLVAIMNAKRNLEISMYQPDSVKPWKGFTGEGLTEGDFIFDINEGRILQSETRSKIKVSTRINAAPSSRVSTSIELNLSSKSVLVK